MVIQETDRVARAEAVRRYADYDPEMVKRYVTGFIAGAEWASEAVKPTVELLREGPLAGNWVASCRCAPSFHPAFSGVVTTAATWRAAFDAAVEHFRGHYREEDPS